MLLFAKGEEIEDRDKKEEEENSLHIPHGILIDFHVHEKLRGSLSDEQESTPPPPALASRSRQPQASRAAATTSLSPHIIPVLPSVKTLRLTGDREAGFLSDRLLSLSVFLSLLAPRRTKRRTQCIVTAQSGRIGWPRPHTLRNAAAARTSASRTKVRVFLFF